MNVNADAQDINPTGKPQRMTPGADATDTTPTARSFFGIIKAISLIFRITEEEEFRLTEEGEFRIVE
jgi:hypothetical protein